MADQQMAAERVSGNTSPGDTKQTGIRQRQGGDVPGQEQAHDRSGSEGNRGRDQIDWSGPDRDNRDIINPDGSETPDRRNDENVRQSDHRR